MSEETGMSVGVVQMYDLMLIMKCKVIGQIETEEGFEFKMEQPLAEGCTNGFTFLLNNDGSCVPEGLFDMYWGYSFWDYHSHWNDDYDYWYDDFIGDEYPELDVPIRKPYNRRKKVLRMRT